MTTVPFPALQAAAIDGRTRNVYYRQEQLEKLHKILVAKENEIVDAIVADSNHPRSEAQIEYALALTELRDRYAELDPKQELENEYAIAHGKDAGNLRVGYGIVYIQLAADHTPFYSAIAPLSAAIAAGNCVIMQVENSLRSLPTLLRNVLKSTLDQDTFDVSQQPVQDSVFLNGCLQVIQNGSVEGPAMQNQLISSNDSVTAAIVDRTANLDEAAKALVNARFAFGGRSPYAPDIILVNEFVKKDLLQALLKYSISFGETISVENGTSNKERNKKSGLQSVISDLQQDGNTRIIAQESNRAILEVSKRSTKFLETKVHEPCLFVHTVKSLDDAIDFINNNGTELLAGYYWGHLAQCKYLSQFISSRVSFVNHIPAELLVGPAFPAHHPVGKTRYPTVLFTRPTPAFVTTTPTSNTVTTALSATSRAEKSTAVQTLRRDAVSDLPVVRKRAKQDSATFGFFEHAMLLNLSLMLVSVGAAVTGVVVFGRRALR